MEFIAITGMHRSGTSLVARVVNLLGADIGPEDELMPPKADNPSGFWEHMPIARLDDDLLGALGGRWNDPPVLSPGWHEQRRLDPFRRRAAEIVEQGFSGEVRMFKDPRASVVLPFWRDVAPIRRTVVCVRDPAAVAKSLERRNRMSPARSASLFVRYTVDSWLDGVDPVVVAFEDILADPVGQAERLAAALGLPPPEARVRDEIAGYVDEGLVRATPDASAQGPAMAEAFEVDAVVRSGDVAAIALALRVIRERTILDADLHEHRSRLRRTRSDLSETVAMLRLTAEQRDELIADRDRALEELEHTGATLRLTAEQRDELIADRDRALQLLEDERGARRVSEAAVQTAEEAKAVMGARLEGTRRQLEVTTARYRRLQGAYAKTARGRLGRLVRRMRQRGGGT